MADETHIPWPKRPDDSNMSLGEMSPEDRRAQMKAVAKRFKAKYAKDLAPAVQIVLAKHDIL